MESDRGRVSVWGTRLVRFRVGQLLGLLFLIGPVSDLISDSASRIHEGAIWITLVAFVTLYLALLPPIRPLVRRGDRAIRTGIAVLAGLATLTLVLGAPRSFALLFVYVVAAAGILLPAPWSIGVACATALAVGGGLAADGADTSTVVTYVLSILAVGSAMTALGSQTRSNRELRAAREDLARLAVSEERLRIARDLHDLLGHTLSVIVLKTELAAKLVESDPRRAQSEMDDVQRVTRQALVDVREALQGYRTLALADAIDEARAAFTAAGIECRVNSTYAELPADVESVLSWGVREATTNIIRHSGAQACSIVLAVDVEAASLQIDDDGSARSAPAIDGSGLSGLAERARRLHGTLEAGARPGGGFRVRLRVPVGAA